ncbi:alpha/beta fold hydrolase [Rhodoplanes sp. TEM]|uniref:Alpha/beta fold hydrolase n=1 Tax=Rhodoplanes tepidamans TaxID=200616 RepID=A0ABT5JCV9_RHOTP|nr:MULTISPECIES: alpha/beta fold hydrolase [Rhodoplanes]MDC7787191.1 alpha/beta fold hydrolase [Rhodoplanes tepidamans]MDC7984245.1 alpha/beta fold hydrolase [Rhodoplanes sp. TEM]MDQ0356042.1 3-oxoadipate enol-lactonase [Rhodoplanes tepidamans]
MLTRADTFTAAVNGTSLRVRLDGPAGAPWLVLSNSLATDLRMWNQQVDALKDRFRILRYDQRGHGGSAPPPAGTDFCALTADLVALLDHVGVETAVLVGVSMGAVTVLRCAAVAPSRCRAVVACDGQWTAPPTAMAAWGERIALAETSGMAALVEPTVSRWFLPDFPLRQPANAALVAEMIAATPVTGYVGCARALQSYDFRADYPGLTVPVHYVVGEKDGLLPSVMAEMARVTPGSRFVTVPAAGHLPNLERPDEYQAVLDAILSGLPTAAPVRTEI